jgi:hypothetical protein
VVLFQVYFNILWNVKEEFMGWWQIMNEEECGTSQDMLMISTSPFTSTDTSTKTIYFCRYFRHCYIFLRSDFLRLWSLDGKYNHWRDFSHIIIEQGCDNKTENRGNHIYGVAQGHTKKATSISVIGLPRVKVLSQHLPGGPEKEQKALRQDLPGFEPGTSKMQVNICRVKPECSVTWLEVEHYYIGEGRQNMYSKY